MKSQKSNRIFYPRRISFPNDKAGLEEFIKEVSPKVLPTSEIAKIAATLAYGRPIDSQSLAVIAAQSIELWNKCEEARNKKIEWLAIYARADAMKNALPKPKSYPVSFYDFLRLMMPKKRAADRMRFYRDYLRQSIRLGAYMKKHRFTEEPFESTPIPSDTEVAKEIAHDKERGFDEGNYSFCASEFLRWFSENENFARRKRAQAGAAALKKKRQKNG